MQFPTLQIGSFSMLELPFTVKGDDRTDYEIHQVLSGDFAVTTARQFVSDCLEDGKERDALLSEAIVIMVDNIDGADVDGVIDVFESRDVSREQFDLFMSRRNLYMHFCNSVGYDIEDVDNYPQMREAYRRLIASTRMEYIDSKVVTIGVDLNTVRKMEPAVIIAAPGGGKSALALDDDFIDVEQELVNRDARALIYRDNEMLHRFKYKVRLAIWKYYGNKCMLVSSAAYLPTDRAASTYALLYSDVYYRKLKMTADQELYSKGYNLATQSLYVSKKLYYSTVHERAQFGQFARGFVHNWRQDRWRFGIEVVNGVVKKNSYGPFGTQSLYYSYVERFIQVNRELAFSEIVSIHGFNPLPYGYCVLILFDQQHWDDVLTAIGQSIIGQQLLLDLYDRYKVTSFPIAMNVVDKYVHFTYAENDSDIIDVHGFLSMVRRVMELDEQKAMLDVFEDVHIVRDGFNFPVA
jgi:hypothetical protein